MTGQSKSGGHDVAADAEKLRKLHVPGDPLLLANVWDPPVRGTGSVQWTDEPRRPAFRSHAVDRLAYRRQQLALRERLRQDVAHPELARHRD
jgi:hypothetical protein